MYIIHTYINTHTHTHIHTHTHTHTHAYIQFIYADTQMLLLRAQYFRTTPILLYFHSLSRTQTFKCYATVVGN